MTCPHCREGKVKFNKTWFIDIDTYLYCNTCGAKLAHINYMTVAVLFAIAVTLLYVIFQHKGVNHSIESAQRSVKTYIVVFYVLICLARLLLLGLLWLIKHPPLFIKDDENLMSYEEQKKKIDEWWAPFVEN
jgi:uncharacterized protein (DUF983 family)